MVRPADLTPAGLLAAAGLLLIVAGVVAWLL